MKEFRDLDSLSFAKDLMLVRDIEDDSASWEIVGRDGEKIKLYKDSLFSVMREDYIPDDVMNICFRGEVMKMPRAISNCVSSVSVDISEGDECYFHHSLCDPSNRVKVGNAYMYVIPYKVNYLTMSMTNVYFKLCKERGEVMVDKWVLLEAIEEEKLKSDTLILLNNKKPSEKYYRVKSVNDNEYGINVGDEVITDKRYVKKINYGGKLAYVVHQVHVFGRRIV